ncbi:MAG: aminoglycoside phosphotransferase family protein [Candidatus Paceibacterota bacterium]|jgi:Ser/Thr protein kinase RdoA (MazF antagonist)
MTTNSYTKKKEIGFLIKKGIVSKYCKIEKVGLGLVHEVYKINTDGKNYVLKIRLDHFKSDKKIKIVPTDIEIEKDALIIVGQKIKNFVPKIILSGNNFLLLEYIAGTSVYELLFKQVLTSKHCGEIAASMANFHKRLANYKKPIREERKELAQYESYLYWRYGIWNHKVLNQIVSDLKKEKKQTIYGDFNPHNMTIRDDKLCIYDLETMHIGNKIFDVGFFLGHLSLHYLNNLTRLSTLLKIFYSNYKISKYEEPILVKIVLATIYYRLCTKNRYETSNNLNKNNLKKIVDNMLNMDISSSKDLLGKFEILLGK